MIHFEQARADALVIAERTSTAAHDVALVLGSGWAQAVETLGRLNAEIPMAELAGFPTLGVAGHSGVVRSVEVSENTRVLVFVGRAHLYEGHPPSSIVHGVRTAVMAGCKVVMLTNAAGGVDPALAVGQPVLISDHLNLTGQNPLVGPPPPPEAGPRFVDLTEVYSVRLRELARRFDPTLSEAVYACFLGPSYETPAEVRMARILGAGLVGMSTVLEAIAARQMGAEVLALSLVTNPAAGVVGAPIDHREVLSAGADAADALARLLSGILTRL